MTKEATQGRCKNDWHYVQVPQNAPDRCLECNEDWTVSRSFPNETQGADARSLEERHWLDGRTIADEVEYLEHLASQTTGQCRVDFAGSIERLRALTERPEPRTSRLKWYAEIGHEESIAEMKKEFERTRAERPDEVEREPDGWTDRAVVAAFREGEEPVISLGLWKDRRPGINMPVYFGQPATVEPRAQQEPPPDHEEFMELRDWGLGTLRKRLDAKQIPAEQPIGPPAAAPLDRQDARAEAHDEIAALIQIAESGCEGDHDDLTCYEVEAGPDWRPCNPCIADKAARQAERSKSKGTLFWPTDPSYPCPTCSHVAVTEVELRTEQCGTCSVPLIEARHLTRLDRDGPPVIYEATCGECVADAYGPEIGREPDGRCVGSIRVKGDHQTQDRIVVEPREGITVPLPIGTPIYLEPKTHTLVEIGFIGAKEVYLDVPREEAIRRYAEANDGMEGVTITEHTVGDVFGAYEIYGT